MKSRRHGEREQRRRLMFARRERLLAARSGLWSLLQATKNLDERKLLRTAIERVTTRLGVTVVAWSARRLWADIAEMPFFVARATHCGVALVDKECVLYVGHQPGVYKGVECSRYGCPSRADCSYGVAHACIPAKTATEEEAVAAS